MQYHDGRVSIITLVLNRATSYAKHLAPCEPPNEHRARHHTGGERVRARREPQPDRRIQLTCEVHPSVRSGKGSEAGQVATRRDDPIQPMTLGNMRQKGVRGLDVTCLHCRHHTEVNVDAHPDDVPVPSFGRRMRCSRCGKLGATAIPNWIERRDSEPGGRSYRRL